MSRYRLTDLEIIREEGSWLCTVRDQHDNKEELLLVPCDSTEHQPVRAWFNECELTPGSSPRASCFNDALCTHSLSLRRERRERSLHRR